MEKKKENKKDGKKGESKYALKVEQRKRDARKLGLPLDTPYPVIWDNR